LGLSRFNRGKSEIAAKFRIIFLKVEGKTKNKGENQSWTTKYIVDASTRAATFRAGAKAAVQMNSAISMARNMDKVSNPTVGHISPGNRIRPAPAHPPLNAKFAGQTSHQKKSAASMSRPPTTNQEKMKGIPDVSCESW
jgi:hypothetical protein